MRTMLEEIGKHTEGQVRLFVFVLRIRCLEYNARGQLFFHVYVTDGNTIMALPLKDARINVAKKKFEGQVVSILVGYDEGEPYIAKIDTDAEVPVEAFGEMVKAEPNISKETRTRLADSRNFQDRNFTVPVLVTGVTQKTTKNGNPYCALAVTDGESETTYNWWNISCDEVKAQYLGQVIYLTIHMEQFPKIIHAETCPDYEAREFVANAPVSVEVMYQSIMTLLAGMKNEAAAVVAKIYEENKENLLRWAGASKLHHAVCGGLLYHVYQMTMAAKAVCSVYAELNAERLLLGVIAHDIGKLRELNTDELGMTQFMPSGNLEGHVILGIEMLTETACSMGLHDSEDLKLLKHMVASHHGKLEWGSPVVPAIPEAMVLHLLDMMDSRLDMFKTALKGVTPGCVSDMRIPMLDGAHVYQVEASTSSDD